MKRIELLFAALLVPLDYLALLLAGLAAYELRFTPALRSIRQVTFDLPFGEFITVVVWLALIWVAIFALTGLYSTRPPSITKEISSIIYATFAGASVALFIAFFSRELFESRFIFLTAIVLALAFVIIERLLVRFVQRILRKLGYGVSQLVLIGPKNSTEELRAFFRAYPRFGYRVAHTIESLNGASLRDLTRWRKKDEIDALLIADPNMKRKDIDTLHAFAHNEHLHFMHSAALFPAGTQRPIVHMFAGIPVIEMPKTPLDGWGAIYKRAFDIFFSLLGLIIFSPVMLLVAIAVKIDSRGPIFYQLDDDSTPLRVGRHGKLFKYRKFRSMYPRTHMQRYNELAHLNTRQGPLVKTKNDPRITRVGRIIRKLSLDELPELWLVLTGRMSLVGPRPHLPEEVDQYRPEDRRVLTIKPGITGLSQISGRETLTFEDEVRLDMHYIQNWSPLLDLVILIKTPFVVLFSRNAS